MPPHKHPELAPPSPKLANGRRPSTADASSSTATATAIAAAAAAAANGGGNVDKVLFKNLVEMVPLVETLMDRRVNSSFTRRASVIYTPAPSQFRKVTDPSGRKTSRSNSAKKRRDIGDNGNLESATDDFSIFSSTAAPGNIQKDREELAKLREQVDDLQKKLLEKDEALKSAENLMNQTNTSLDDLRHQVVDQDSLIKSTNSQLYNAKIKLADKQAALEKLEWEANMSNRKVEELQENIVSTEFEVTALMQFFDELSKHESAAYPHVEVDCINYFEHLPHIDDMDVEKMEEARTAYLAAVAAAKENPNDELIAAAAEARTRLQAFVI